MIPPAGAFIAFICVIIKTKIFTSGWKKLSKYDELFLFLKPLPFGLSVFNGIVSILSPYSGNIFPSILFLTTNKCVMKIQQRWALQNPFNSVHAVALANLGEQASGKNVWKLVRSIVRHSSATASMRLQIFDFKLFIKYRSDGLDRFAVFILPWYRNEDRDRVPEKGQGGTDSCQWDRFSFLRDVGGAVGKGKVI